jgi:hypothetical protein
MITVMTLLADIATCNKKVQHEIGALRYNDDLFWCLSELIV